VPTAPADDPAAGFALASTNRCWPLVPTEALAPAAGLSAPPALADAEALGGAFWIQPLIVTELADCDCEPGARV
jgi:hypothetical protein